MKSDKQLEFIWYNEADYLEHLATKKMSNGDMLKQFHETYLAKRNRKWLEEPGLEELASKLIVEEFKEFMDETGDDQAALLKELADLVYVCYGYADRFGWDLDEAFRRVHLSNMSKLDPVTGKPIFREDGKILKSSAYREPSLKDLV
jgi:phosphoribosyl-ATP pyrophosphohydrolase